MPQLEELLSGWIPRQRWFAGKGVPISSVAIEERHTLVPGDPGLRVLVVAVGQRETVYRYQVLLGSCQNGRLPNELAHAAIGNCELPDCDGSRTVYDATHDPELTARLLDRIATADTSTETTDHTANGEQVRFRRLPGAAIHSGLRSLVLPEEQSNTSLVYGEDYVLKTFRRLLPGHNPDLELTSALAGSPYVARPHGWIEADLVDAGRPVRTTLAMLQEYLRSATDGWVLAATSVRDLYAAAAETDTTTIPDPAAAGGDFAGEAGRLGDVTAAVHLDLAKKLSTDVLSPRTQQKLATSMKERLSLATAEVPQLLPYADRLRVAFDAFAELDEPLPVQRVHGDYHLGQVVRTDTGWVLLDFEGEPGAPVHERQRLCSPLRDVAGMLRSFDYAARHQLVGHALHEKLTPVANAWAHRNREAFCAGYAYGGGVDPEKHQTALRAFEFDKAVYEVLYEARNRPAWLSIPLSSIAALSD